MAKVLVDESCFSGIADAIREKTSSTATYKPREMADAISKIQGGEKTKFGLSVDNFVGSVDDNGVLQPVASTPVNVSFDGVTSIGSDYSGAATAFVSCSAMCSVSFPDIATLSGDDLLRFAFKDAKGLTSLKFPKLTSVLGSRVFDQVCYSCGTIREIAFPKLARVNGSAAFSYAFIYCNSLTAVEFPELEEVVGNSCFDQAFYGCSKVASISFPRLRVISCDPKDKTGGRQFQRIAGGTRITELSFPALEEVYANGSSQWYAPFYDSVGSATKKATLYFPKLKKVGTNYTGVSSVSDTTIKNMLYGSYISEIHFGAANQAAVEAMPGYDTLWSLGAGNATVYFDL